MRRFRNKVTGSVIVVDDITAAELPSVEWVEVLASPAPKPTRAKSK